MIDSGEDRFQIDLLFDTVFQSQGIFAIVQMFAHAFRRQHDVLGFDRFDDVGMMMMGTSWRVRSVVQRDDQAGLRCQFANHAHQDCVAGQFRQQDVELARQADELYKGRPRAGIPRSHCLMSAAVEPSSVGVAHSARNQVMLLFWAEFV